MSENNNIDDVAGAMQADNALNEVVRILAEHESNRPRIEHQSDAEPRMQCVDGVQHIVFGDGSYIELNPERENKYHPANR